VTLIAVVMLVILAVAGLVVAFVAFPHRGQELPAAPWLGEAMARAAEAAPVIQPDESSIMSGARDLGLRQVTQRQDAPAAR
jgi:hypothetical protein